MNKMLGYLKDYKRESVLAPLFKMLEAITRRHLAKINIWLEILFIHKNYACTLDKSCEIEDNSTW